MRFYYIHNLAGEIMLNLSRTIECAKEKGLSNTFLAKKLGRTSASLFVDWRKGKSKPTEQDIMMLAELLDTTVDYLTDKTNKKEKPFAEAESLSKNDIEFLAKIRKLNPSNLELAKVQIDALLALQEKQGK